MARYDLDGRVVAITGSTGGLGTSLSKALRKRGARLVLLARDAEVLAQQSAALGGDEFARGWTADVRHFESLARAMDNGAAHFGKIDIVCANAGIESIATLESGDVGEFENLIDVNLTGVWRTFKAGLPHVARQQGYLAAISSMAAFVHSPLQSAYTASKAGVWAMCDSLRLELRPIGVDVGSYHPVFFDTPLLSGMQTQPATEKIWHGNDKGLWKTVSKTRVVGAIVRGMERRAKLVTVPRRLKVVAMMPGVFHPIIDRVGFADDDISEAVALAARD